MPVQKAIETVYKGHKFRSRLEARFAVLLNALGVKYEYETEGLILRDGTYYLPDFYLPESGWFVEVKGSLDDEEGVRKAQLLDNYPPKNKNGELITYGCLIFTNNKLDLHEGWTFYQRILEEMDEAKIERAILKAKQARFEHGRSGN